MHRKNPILSKLFFLWTNQKTNSTLEIEYKYQSFRILVLIDNRLINKISMHAILRYFYFPSLTLYNIFLHATYNKNHKVISNPRNKLLKRERKTIISLTTEKGKNLYNTKKIKIHSSSLHLHFSLYPIISIFYMNNVPQKRNENKN